MAARGRRREMRALFADVPRTRRWLDLLALLAEVQAEHGLIPAEAAQDIRATCRSIEVDADFLAANAGKATKQPPTRHLGLIAAVARRCSGSGGEWFYFGATVQDLTDTWLMLTLREARAHSDRRSRSRDSGDGRPLPAPSRHGHGRANPRPAGLADHFRLQGRRLARRAAAAPPRFDEAAQRMDVGQLCGGVGSLSAMGLRGAGGARALPRAPWLARARHVVDGEPRHSRRMGAPPRALHRHGRPDRP